MFLCINYILSNPCFVLVYLQLTKVLSTAAGPTASSGDEDTDDGTAGVVQVISAEHAECESLHPESCPPEMPTSSSSSISKSKSKVKSKSSAGVLKERADESRRLQERVETLSEQHDTSCNTRVQFGLYLTGMIPLIHDSLLIDFFDETHRFLLQYMHRSESIQLPERQQQQQHQPHIHFQHPPQPYRDPQFNHLQYSAQQYLPSQKYQFQPQFQA